MGRINVITILLNVVLLLVGLRVCSAVGRFLHNELRVSVGRLVGYLRLCLVSGVRDRGEELLVAVKRDV